MVYKNKEDAVAYSKKYRETHKDEINKRQLKYKSSREIYAKIQKEWFDQLKSTYKCINCGETDIVCLDFHHINPSIKDKSMGNYRFYSKSRVLKELEKCVCLCSNCHKKFHAYNWVVKDGKICMGK